jgi:hypothetical protein
VYGGCSLPTKPKCDVSTGGGALGTITTNSVEGELVYLTKADAEALNPEESGTLLRPVGNAGNFVTIGITPVRTSGCPVDGSETIKGNVLTRNDEPIAKVLLQMALAETPTIEKYFEGMTGTSKVIKNWKWRASP